MGLLNIMLGTQNHDENPCPNCGRLARLVKGNINTVKASTLDTGVVRTGYQCQKCETLYHNSCASEECLCGSKDLRQVIISNEMHPCYAEDENKNCEECGLHKRYCRCSFYRRWEKK